MPQYEVTEVAAGRYPRHTLVVAASGPQGEEGPSGPTGPAVIAITGVLGTRYVSMV